MGSDYAKKIDKERKNQTRQNKKDKEEFSGIELPNAMDVLPKYYVDARTKALNDKLINLASDPQIPVKENDLWEITTHCMVYLSTKSCHRPEILGNMTRLDYLKAKESSPTFYPWRKATQAEIEDPKLKANLTDGYIFER